MLLYSVLHLSLTVGNFAIATHLHQKISNIRQSTAVLSRLPAKHCILDSVPTCLLEKSLHTVTSVLCSMYKSSLKGGQFASKNDVIYPRLKKPLLHACDAISIVPTDVKPKRCIETRPRQTFLSQAESNDQRFSEPVSLSTSPLNRNSCRYHA